MSSLNVQDMLILDSAAKNDEEMFESVLSKISDINYSDIVSVCIEMIERWSCMCKEKARV